MSPRYVLGGMFLFYPFPIIKFTVMIYLITNFLTFLGAFLIGGMEEGADTVSKRNEKLTVLCYNIHHANPPSKGAGFIDMDAIANVITEHNPDVVALQEVDVNINRSGNIDQARILAEKSGMKYYYFGKAIDHDGGDYGVAILSKHELSGMETIKLPADPETKSEPRVLAVATVEMANGFRFVFGTTHLEVRHESNRLMQVAAIQRYAESLTLPFVIAGDFNAKPESESIKALDKTFQRTCEDCAPTIPVINPTRAIDFIAFTPADYFKVLRHEVVDETYASDHLPVYAELEVLPQ